jgi:dolichol-phosphate mannosyltransferase
MPDKHIDISFILPTYNEKENIVDLILELDLYSYRYIYKNIEFIIVDDNSEDKTWEVAQDYFIHDLRIKVIRRLNQRGLPSAIDRGIQEAKGDIVAWLDCDFSHPPYKFVELLQKIEAGYDLAMGSRFIKGGQDVRGQADSWMAVILSRLMNYFIALVLGGAIKDYTSGFVAVKKEVFNKIKIKGDYGEYFIEFIYNARRLGYKIIEVPYYCVPRRKGVSKTGNNLGDYISKGFKYIILTLKLKLRIC